MKLILKIIIPFVILLIAVGLFMGIKSLKKPPQKQTQQRVVPQAEYIVVQARDHSPPVMSYGTVQSFYTTRLVAEVSGKIVMVAPDFQVGKLVKKGAVLVKIDYSKYLAALARERANLAAAKRTLAEEEIRATQAAEDWVASGRDLAAASDFVLRKPQLAAARANITSIQAAVDDAGLDLQRTQIRAPFDAVVTERAASPGNLATQQQVLGTLVATERAEVRLPLTAEQVKRVQLPPIGGGRVEPVTVDLTSSIKPGVVWQAELKRTEPAVDARNQVTYVIAELKSPYESKSGPLVIGSFVQARIPANKISHSYQVPEPALVNDLFVWAIDNENKLVRIAAERVYSHEGLVYLKLKTGPAEKGLRIVVRPLTNFQHGIEVKPVAAKTENRNP